jgi:hypothetical protein
MKYRKRSLTASQQYQDLRCSSLTCNGSGKLGIGRFNYECELRPTVISRSYRISIVFTYKKRPKVLVLQPDLVELGEKRKLPHVYSQSPPELCLYLPGTGEWANDKFVSRTIVPWSMLWLYYFEHWLATGIWEGGGAHPTSDNTTRRKNKRKGARRRVSHINS